MKSNLHPQWHHDTVVTCSCGNSFVTGSITPTMQVDICSNCHPFFTGEVRFVDRQGRVDKFLQRQKKAEALRATQPTKSKKAAGSQQDPQSYQEILNQQQRALKQVAKTRVTKAAA